jgi:hypothetical protein
MQIILVSASLIYSLFVDHCENRIVLFFLSVQYNKNEKNTFYTRTKKNIYRFFLTLFIFENKVEGYEKDNWLHFFNLKITNFSMLIYDLTQIVC